jgi:hypothetical protein
VFAFEPLPEAFDKLDRPTSKWKDRILALNLGLNKVESQFELKFGNPSSELASFGLAVQEIEFVGGSDTNSVTT